MERKNGNWTIKKTEKKFANDFFKVFNDKVIQPDGKDGSYATIEFVSGVTVLPIDDEDFVYLTNSFDTSPDKTLWKSLPAELKTKKRLTRQSAKSKKNSALQPKN